MFYFEGPRAPTHQSDIQTWRSASAGSGGRGQFSRKLFQLNKKNIILKLFIFY